MERQALAGSPTYSVFEGFQILFIFIKLAYPSFPFSWTIVLLFYKVVFYWLFVLILILVIVFIVIILMKERTLMAVVYVVGL